MMMVVIGRETSGSKKTAACRPRARVTRNLHDGDDDGD